MKNVITYLFTIMLLISFSCSSDKPTESTSPLEGVWELVKGEWDWQDTTFLLPSPGFAMKSMKYYSKRHFFVIGKDFPTIGFHAASGTYTINGDEYTEVLEISSLNNVGDNVVIKFHIEDDILNLESSWFTEAWKRIE